MAKPRRTEPTEINRAQFMAATAISVEALRQCQAVLSPEMFGATLEQKAKAIGVGRATVARLQTDYRKSQSPILTTTGNWGSRRQALLSQAEEVAFLKPWLDKPAAGHFMIPSPIRADLSQRLGQQVKPSVVYRLLARHGWRKIAPDTRHPKSDLTVQEDWKKNSQKFWRPCSPEKPSRDAMFN